MALTKMLDAQNTALASSGAGNVYQRIFESELKQKRKSPKGIEHLKKAYRICESSAKIGTGTTLLRGMNSVLYLGLAKRANKLVT